MNEVVIATGSNIGPRHQHLQDAWQFLCRLSSNPPKGSAIYLTEPVGPATRYFLNGAVQISTTHPPIKLLKKLKTFERKHGRDAAQPRWSARTIDLDIISFGNLVIQSDNLIIPHPEYHKRLFVLKPLHDIDAHWTDPATAKSIDTMIAEAPDLQLKKTTLSW